MNKKIILLFLSLFYFTQASANLLDKVKLEELLENRIEKKLMTYDEKIKIVVRFIFKPTEKLPGLTLEDSESFEPMYLSVADILSIKVEIHSHLPEVTTDMQDVIYKIIPVNKTRIKLAHIQRIEKPVVVHQPIVAKDLWDISSHMIDRFLKAIIIMSSVALLLLLSAIYLLQRNNTIESRQNFGLLSKSFSENTSMGLTGNSNTADNNNYQSPQDSQLSAKESIHLSAISLKEILADCYWCHEDEYAHWLWKQLTFQEKQEAILTWTPLKKYSSYFVGLKSKYKDFHAHPYYLQPENLTYVSQEALVKEISKKPDMWLGLSPMRQEHLAIPIADKMQVIKKGQTVKFPTLSIVSTERELPLLTNFGALSFSDETTILNDPELVPTNLKDQVSSLVWLSLQKSDFITETLSQYDARSLASAWVGAPEILKHLETCMPEKKLKMLHRYLEQNLPSRESSTYKALVNAGLMNNVA